jgi:hypothetical protein
VIGIPECFRGVTDAGVPGIERCWSDALVGACQRLDINVG